MLPRPRAPAAARLACGCLALGFAAAAAAQTTPSADRFNQIFGNIVRQIKTEKRSQATALSQNRATDAQAARQNAMDAVHDSLIPYVQFLAAEQSLANLMSETEEKRLDKQVGGGASNSGSTSLVSKGSVPALFGFAVENGALLESVSGTTITFRGNPAGILKALEKKHYLASGMTDETDPAIRFLNKISFAVSFDTSRGAQSNTFTGDRQQLSGYSFRFDVRNKRDPRHPEYVRSWNGLLAQSGTLLANRLQTFNNVLRGLPAFTAWRDAAILAIDQAAEDKVDAVVAQQAEAFRKTLGTDPQVQQAVKGAADALSLFVSGRNQLLNGIAKSLIVTFEYTNSRQKPAAGMMMAAAGAAPAASMNPAIPDLSNFKVIAQGRFVGKAEMTGNASLTIFNSIPAGMRLGRVRDYRLSGEFDIPLPEIQGLGQSALTFSGLFLALRQPALGMPVVVNDQMIDTKGNVGLFQAKFTIPVKGGGVKIPFSLTYATRTELNKEADVRGNIGLTLDLDTIFARAK